MRVPVSWLREHADLSASVTGRELADRLIAVGHEVERVETVGDNVRGVVVGRVLEVEDLTEFKKPIRWCLVDVGDGEPRGIVCGATNFVPGDTVLVALPGAVLPGGFEIGARKTYGHVSDGMICSARELALGDEYDGIMVLAGADAEVPLGSDAVAAFGLRDEVLDIAVTPNRGDCWSVRGMAREAAIAFDVGFTDPAVSVEPLAPVVDGPPVEVRLDDPIGCDRYVAHVVRGLDPAARTPLALQRRLTLAGMRPLSLAVDVTNLVMLWLGQPLHAFDAAALSGGIVVRRATAGERLTTLDGTDRRLDPEDLVIADASGPVALAGLMGGGPTEVSPATTDLVIEAAHFDPVTAARMARRHKLPTEATRRFERGVDPALPPVAAALAASMLARYGGAAAGPVTDARAAADAEPVVIRMPVGLPGRLVGVEYDPELVVRSLRAVGCAVVTEHTGRTEPTAQSRAELDVVQAVPPTWRPDLCEPVDLVEEVARLAGYEAIPSVLPAAPAGRGLSPRQRRTRALSRAVAAAGCVEVMSSPFVGGRDLDLLNLPADDPRRDLVRLANPLDDNRPALRTTLLPGLVDAALRNVARGAPDLALYEIGSVYRPRPGSGSADLPPARHRPGDATLVALDASLPDQPTHLAALLTGRWEAAGWWGPGRDAVWSDAVAVAHTAARSVGVALAVEQADDAVWHQGRCAALVLAGERIGLAGELHPRVVAATGLPPRTCAVELALGPLLAAAPDAVPAPVISTFPPASEDVALVVADEVPVAAVEAALRHGGGDLLEEVRLFDVWTGHPVPSGHRSLAFNLRLRAPDRTLTTDEANEVRDAAVAEAARQVDAVQRS